MPNILGDVLTSIGLLLANNEPQFIQTGFHIFLAAATIVLCWEGIQMMFSGDSLNEHLGVFARLVLMLSIGYAMNSWYATPIPGIGQSLTGLLSSQGTWAMHVLDDSVYERVTADLTLLTFKFSPPGVFSVGPGMLYVIMIIIVALVEAAITLEVVGGIICLAVVALFGPLFAPFFIVPRLDWLFWGWLKAMVMFSFYPAVAIGYLVICEGFLHRVITSVPDVIVPDLYLTYGFSVIVTIVMLGVGIVTLVPKIVAALFSGGVGHGGGLVSTIINRSSS